MTPLKKIIIIGPAFPYRGGNSLFVSYLYSILKDKFAIKIYNYKLLYPSIFFPGTTQFDRSEKIIKKVPNIRILNSISPFNWLQVANRLKKEKADLIVFDWWHPFFAFCHFTISLFIKKQYHNKIIFITENVISHESNFVDK
ncbi:MAG: glycosyl transferase family 1, partial [Ignavibacteriales bacterium CG12_big_fil_rev_8_21_14_0_65_30_8]